MTKTWHSVPNNPSNVLTRYLLSSPLLRSHWVLGLSQLSSRLGSAQTTWCQQISVTLSVCLCGSISLYHQIQLQLVHILNLCFCQVAKPKLQLMNCIFAFSLLSTPPPPKIWIPTTTMIMLTNWLIHSLNDWLTDLFQFQSKVPTTPVNHPHH